MNADIREMGNGRRLFDVVLQKGTTGLCLNVAVKEDTVTVIGFRRPTVIVPHQIVDNNGNVVVTNRQVEVMGPAETCGLIKNGDILLGVNDYTISGAKDFEKMVPLIKSPDPVKLTFHRPLIIPSNENTNSTINSSSTSTSNSTINTNQSSNIMNPPQTIQQGINNYINQPNNNNAFPIQNVNPAIMLNREIEHDIQTRFNGINYMLSVEQKDQLRSQIMVFKYLSHSIVAPPSEILRHSFGYLFTLNLQSNPNTPKFLLNHLNTQKQNQGINMTNGNTRRYKALRKNNNNNNNNDIYGSNKAIPSKVSSSTAYRTMNPRIVGTVTKSKRGRKKKKKMNEIRSSDEEVDNTIIGNGDDDSQDEDYQENPSISKASIGSRRSNRNVGKIKKTYNDEVMNEELASLLKEEEKIAAARKKEFNQREDGNYLDNKLYDNDDNGPKIEKIVGVRYFAETENDEPHLEYLIKWKNTSYLSLTWVSEIDLENDLDLRRITQYQRKNDEFIQDRIKNNLILGNTTDKDYKDTDENKYFSESFIEIDRIIDSKTVQNEKVIQYPGKEYYPEYNNNIIKENNTNIYTENGDIFKSGIKYLIKWRDLSYVDCSWEYEDKIQLLDDSTDKIATYYRINHMPMIQSAHPAMFNDIRPDPTNFAKYKESLEYKNNNFLRSYQLESLNWLMFCWYNRRNCILADEMGLGKTVQATVIMEHLRQREHIRGPFLVVAPLATLGNWKREIENWTNMNCVVYHDSEGGEKTRQFIRNNEFYFNNNNSGQNLAHRKGLFKFNLLITSYNVLINDIDFFSNVRWRYLVVDEAHKLKNKDTKLLQSMRLVPSDSKLLMTGTPLQNGVQELWCLLNYIEPNKFNSQEYFIQLYGDLATVEQVSQLHEELRPYMLRRVKEDVEKSIPQKEETIIDVELTTLQKKYYRAIFERNRAFLNKGSSITVGNLTNIEMELRKCCNHPYLIKGVEKKENKYGPDNETDRMKVLIQASGKTVLLDKMINKFFIEKKKVLIFSQFKIMLDILEDLLNLRHYGYERMDGSVRGNARQAAIDRFNETNNDNCFIFLLSTKAGGVGINLIAASVVILFDSDWNPQNDLQAIARCHRIGQKKSVRIFRLVTKKTYEAQMFEIASRKLGLHHAVFETGGVNKNFMPSTNSNNMMSLLALDKDKIETMIRYGAYAILEDEEQDPDNKNLNEADIDQILNNSRVIRYNDTNNKKKEDDTNTTNNDTNDTLNNNTKSTYNPLSFSKASFTAENSDNTIDFHDDKFWEKVLGPKPILRLVNKLKTINSINNSNINKNNIQEIKNFLIELRELAVVMVEERQKGGTFEDSDDIEAILVDLKVAGPIVHTNNININMRELATNWLNIIEKPKRRRNQNIHSNNDIEELMYHPLIDGPKKLKIKQKKRTNNINHINKNTSKMLDDYLDNTLNDDDKNNDNLIYDNDHSTNNKKKLNSKKQVINVQKLNKLNHRKKVKNSKSNVQVNNIKKLKSNKNLSKIKLKDTNNNKTGIKIYVVKVNSNDMNNIDNNKNNINSNNNNNNNLNSTNKSNKVSEYTLKNIIVQSQSLYDAISKITDPKYIIINKINKRNNNNNNSPIKDTKRKLSEIDQIDNDDSNNPVNNNNSENDNDHDHESDISNNFENDKDENYINDEEIENEMDENQMEDDDDDDETFVIQKKNKKLRNNTNPINRRKRQKINLNHTNSSNSNNNNSTMIPNNNKNKKLYARKKMYKLLNGENDKDVDTNMWCHICYKKKAFLEDPLIRCDKCKISVHKFCYGITKIPRKNISWYCKFCEVTADKESTDKESINIPTCELCPLKRQSAFTKTIDNKWVHSLCALWIPEARFGDLDKMSQVKNVKTSVIVRKNYKCACCELQGGCISCKETNCSVHFHTFCGKENKNYNMFTNDEGELLAYCPSHNPDNV